MLVKPIAYNKSLGGMNNFAEQKIATSISVDEFHFEDKTPFKVFVQVEPNEVIDTERILIVGAPFYDLILAWNDNVLQACPNAQRFIFGTSHLADPYVQVRPEEKEFALSFLTSDKGWCPGHILRRYVYDILPDQYENGLKVVKYMSPPLLEDKGIMLRDYQYSFIAENVRRKNWIASATIDCFLMKCIPIYWGAPNLNEFFDMKGVITFDDFGDDGVATLLKLTPEYYASKIDSIEYNYLQALKFLNFSQRVDQIVKETLDALHPGIS